MVNDISVDITPDKSLIQKLGLVGYRTVQAVAELLDNSIDARIENTKEEILVRLNFEERQIVVRDDGRGMDQNDLKNALTIAKSTKSDGHLGQFGIGLKSACSALGKTFTIRTSKVGSGIEYETTYDEARWFSANSLDWKNFIISKKTLSPDRDWHGTEIVIRDLRVPLYPTQVTKFKENFGLRYALYLQENQVSIRLNTGLCTPHRGDMEDESKILLELRLPMGQTIHGYVALLKKRSIQGNYGINLFKHGRLIKSFAKFGFSAHPETAKIIGELNLDHVPVNFYKSEFIEESEEYLQVLEKFKNSDALKSIQHLAKSESYVTASVESVFDYFNKKSKPQHLEKKMRANLARELLINTKPFDVELYNGVMAQIQVRSLKHKPLYAIKNINSKKMTVTINCDDASFKFVKNPLFLIGMIASEIRILSTNPDFEKFVQTRNSDVGKFLASQSENNVKKETCRDRQIQIPDIPNYRLADELIDPHDFLKENAESRFQFTAMSTLVPYLHNLRGKIVYTLYTTTSRGQDIVDLLSERFDKHFVAVNEPDEATLYTLFNIPDIDRIIAVREYGTVTGSTIAAPDKAFVDLVVEAHTYGIPIPDSELRRMFHAMERHGLINLKEIHRYAKSLKKSQHLDTLLE